MKSYGISEVKTGHSEQERHLESLTRKGYSVQSGVFDSATCDALVTRVRNVYQNQENEFGKAKLESISELNIARMPFMSDPVLMDLFLEQQILDLVAKRIGGVFQIHLQNAIINKGNLEHHQSSWHRDLPYQNWVISKPLAVNAFVCLTDFTSVNGATYILPYSQNFDEFPSLEYAEENKVQLTGKKGDVVFFDSMCFHQAGYNSTEDDRIGVNNMFVVPIIKQQIDLSSFTIDRPFSDLENRILGKTYVTPRSVSEYHEIKSSK